MSGTDRPSDPEPRPIRFDKDLNLDSPDAIIGPFAPSRPNDQVMGASTFVDPFHPKVEATGRFHRLPPDYQPPEESGLAIHADGADVPGIDMKSAQPWGHRTIYPTVAMTAAEFAQRVADLPWEYAGNKKREK